MLLLGAIVYWITHTALESQFNGRIELEVATLSAQHRTGGIERLTTLLRERASAEAWGRFRYLLVNSDHIPIEATLIMDSPPPLGWYEPAFDRAPSGAARQLRILTVAFPDAFRLSVASDLTPVRDVEKAVFDAFGWAFAGTLLLGMGGGLFVSSRFLARVDGIASTAQAIIDGDLKQRIPVRDENDDLDRLAQTLNQMLNRINELMESVRQVSNDIAHELRTPLSRLRHRLEVALASTNPANELREPLVAAIGESDEILATFSALLRIAQIEAGTRRAAFADVDWTSLVTDVVEAFAPSIQDECKILKVSIAPGINALGDRELLTQLLANLIENAIRHTPTGTTVDVSLRSVSTGIQLVVADNGYGIPTEAHEKLFDRFFRLEKSRTTPGSGLGLSLVKAIVDLHNGRIEIADNAPGLRLAILFPTLVLRRLA